uniref:Ricin B-type lectin domain-containing protein n=1 Tax=Ascaris lumbricoides TaxID=6252 RepID=A0A0M3HLC2_ASCLU
MTTKKMGFLYLPDECASTTSVFPDMRSKVYQRTGSTECAHYQSSGAYIHIMSCLEYASAKQWSY